MEPDPMPTLSPATTEVEIKGATYAVEPIAPGEGGVSAVRVVKLKSGESYDVIRTKLNVVECSCPDYICRHEGKGTVCKHGAAMIARGYLPAPVRGGSPVAAVTPPAAVAPITPDDVKRAKRAKFFKLNIPAPMAVEAPAPIVEPTPEPAPAENPRDSWPAWTDEATWELGPDAEPIEPPAPSTKALADRLWLAETTALLITNATVLDVEDGQEDDPDAVFERLEPENQAAFHCYLKMIGSPVATWHDWLDLCWEGSPVCFPEPTGPCPTHRERFTPTAEMDMERLGYELAIEGQDASPGAGRTPAQWRAFEAGFQAGRAALAAEFEAWLAEVEAQRDLEEDAFDPTARVPQCELVRGGSACGHPCFEN
jgi:hypothetical protein